MRKAVGMELVAGVALAAPAVGADSAEARTTVP
jgi:hypothetical protein